MTRFAFRGRALSARVADWGRDPRGVFAVTTAVSAALLVAVLVMINIAVWYQPWSIDLTASGRNEISDEAKRILGRTPAVTLRQFGRVTADARREQILRALARESRAIHVEFADIDRERDQAAAFGVLKVGTVVVMAGDKFRKVEEPSEPSLITAILQVTADEDRSVCFVAGHGERGLKDSGATGLAMLSATLTASNYGVDSISLLEGDVPQTCAAVIVAGARQALDSVETERLDAYMLRAGRMAVLLEPDPAPSFADVLRPFGINPGAGSVIDASGAGQQVGQGPRTPIAFAYGDHPVTRGFNVVTLYNGARPLEAIDHPEHGGKPVELALTAQRSFASNARDAVPAFDRAHDKAGPLPLAVATTLGPVSQPERQARLAVFGDSDFISNGFLRHQGNRDLFMRTLAWLMGEQEATIVAVAPHQNRRLTMTAATGVWMYVVNIGLVPLIPLGAGIVMFLRRRR